MFGLFGYNERTYDKNTGLYKQRLNSLYDNLTKRNLNTFEVGNAITSVISVLDWYEFPSGQDPRNQKMVDDYLSELIGKIEMSAQQQNTAKLVLQLKMLNELIGNSRSYGKLSRTPADLHAQEILNDCLGELNQVGYQKEQIRVEKERILDECELLDKMGEKHKIPPLKNQYMQLESKEKTLARKENELSKTYQYNCDALANAEDRDFYAKLGAGGFVAVSPKEVGKLVQEISTAIDKNNAAVMTGMDILNDFDKDYKANAGSLSSNSDFESALENRKAKGAMNNINGANYTPQETAGVDSFEEALRNRRS